MDFVQTAESTPLPAFRWPKRTVLVLGHEHTGIPLNILRVQASLGHQALAKPEYSKYAVALTSPKRRSWMTPW